MFNRKLKERLQEAEAIIHSFETMLNFSHLSENKSVACNFCRKEIRDYKERWKDTP